MDISVVIPLLNEAGSLPELHQWLTRVLQKMGRRYEILFVDDGSTDGSWQVIEALHKEDEKVKGIRFRRNFGKSAALNEGFHNAQGEVIITMDADLQDSPDEIPELYRMIITDEHDLVSGWKKKRHDPITKTIPSKFFNWVTRRMSGIHIHDFNCGLKAYRKAVVKEVEVYGEMHRYIPVIAKWAGFPNITEKVVSHRPRRHGKTKFGWERFINGFLDLLSIMFVTKFGKRPMHLFGTIGTLCFLGGAGMTAWIIGSKLYSITWQLPYRDATDQPLFYIALVVLLAGIQLFLAGFIGELVSRNAPDRNQYQVAEVLGTGKE